MDQRLQNDVLALMDQEPFQELGTGNDMETWPSETPCHFVTLEDSYPGVDVIT